MAEYPDCMVDIETTGTMPDRNAILQISAMKFNLETGNVDTTNYFDRCLFIPSHRFWDEGTRNWWSRQKKSVIQGIFSRAEHVEPVLDDLVKWAMSEGEQPRFWSKPTHFDFMFIASYLKDYGKAQPFHYRFATDMNSYLRGLFAAQNREVPELDIPFVGDAHDGFYDTVHQIKTLFSYVQEARN